MAGGNIKIKFTADTTDLQAGTARASRDVDRMSGRYQQSTDRMTKSSGKLKLSMGGLFAAGGTLGAGAMAVDVLTRALGAGAQAYVGYDTALREVGAVSGATGKTLQALGKTARRAGIETGVGATAATQALGELAKAGLDVADIGPALKGTLLLAQAGGLETADAAKAAANAMQTFGLEAKDVTVIADSLANAANLTTADVNDFAIALAQGGSAANLAGVSFKDTVLALTDLARIGVKGSDAGTSLKSAFLQLLKPTDEAAEVMKKYGLAFTDADGQMKSVSEISGMLQSKLGGLSNQQQVATLKTIAGTEGFRTLAAMMRNSSAESDTLARQLGKTGSAAETARKKQAGLAGDMNRLKAVLQEVAIAAGDLVAPAISDAAKTITRFITQVQRGTGAGGDFAKAFKAAAAVVSVALKPVVRSIGIMLDGVVGTLRGTAKTISAVIGVISDILSGDFRKAWQGVKKVFRAGVDTMLSVVKAVTAPLKTAIDAIGNALGVSFSKVWNGILGTATSFVNTLIDVINVIPGVDIGHVGKKSVSNGGGSSKKNSVGFFARGGEVDRPMFMVGEEAPRHNEWVIATNPAYRKNNIAYWAQAGHDLGVPGFKTGGLPSGGSGQAKTNGGGLSGVVRDILEGVGISLPSNPFTGVFTGVGSFILKKVGSYVSSMFGGGDGSGPGGMVGFANRLEKMGIPYGPQGHSGWPINRAGEDCSSSVSKVLHGGGVPLPGVQTTVTMPSVLESGPGKRVTVYNRPLPGDAGHMIMSIGGRFFGTSRTNPGGGPGWLGPQSASYLATLPQRLHPKGFAKGGLVTASEYGGSDGDLIGSTKYGWAELSNNYSATGRWDFSALGGLPRGTKLKIGYRGRSIIAPKVDVGAGGPGLGGRKRAIDLTQSAARRLGFSGLGNVTWERVGGGGSSKGSGGTVSAPARPSKMQADLLKKGRGSGSGGGGVYKSGSLDAVSAAIDAVDNKVYGGVMSAADGIRVKDNIYKFALAGGYGGALSLEDANVVRGDQRSLREGLAQALRDAAAGVDTSAVDTSAEDARQQELIDAQNAAADAANAAAEAARAQTEAINGLQATIAKGQQYAERISGTDFAALKRAIADVASGELGGRVGLGFASPSFAGSGVRY